MSPASIDEVLPQALSLLDETVASLRDDDWDQPSNLDGWSVRELVGHVTGSVHKASALIAAEPINRARSEPSEWVVDEPLERLRSETAQVLDRLPGAPLGELRPSPAGEVPLQVALTFPAVDAVVHSWDIGHSVGRPLEIAPSLLEFAEALTDRMDTGKGPVPGFDAPVAPADSDTRTETLMKRLGRPTDSAAAGH